MDERIRAGDVAGFTAIGANCLGTVFEKITVFEEWARRLTGEAFIPIGVYYVLIYLVGLDI